MKTCSNCLEMFEGNYCYNCGQRSLKIPYSFKNVLIWINDSFDFNRGFLITFYHLLTNPKRVVSTYLNGNTKIYVSPVKYFLLIIALVFFILTSLSEEQYLTYLVAIGIVLYFWLVNMLLYWNSRLNAVEHLLIVVYETTEFILLAPLSVIILFVLVELLSIINVEAKNIALMLSWTGLILIYHIWFSIRVFGGKSFIIVLKPLMSFLLAFILTGLVSQLF